jgi:hypothetical protein
MVLRVRQPFVAPNLVEIYWLELSQTQVGPTTTTLIASPGSFSLTGFSADLTKTAAQTLSADPGSYALTGSSAELLYNRLISADAGSYALTGSNAELLYNRFVFADAGAYALTGFATTLDLNRFLSADAGSYALTGFDATLFQGTLLEADAGAYSLTGFAANLDFGRVVLADPGSYNLSGVAATLSPSVIRPNSDITTTNWTASAGTVLYDMIDEAVPDDNDYIISPDITASPGPAVFGLNGTLPSGPLQIQIRAKRSYSSGQIRVVLQDSSGNSIGTSSWQTLTSSFTTYTLSVSTSGIVARARIEVQT